MNKKYKQLTLIERREIQAGLEQGSSFRQIAQLIERSPSTISREIIENRTARSPKSKKAPCRQRQWCKRINICSECVRFGIWCSECDAKDCREQCRQYATQSECDTLVRAPWVCNGCRKNHYGCNKANRYVYDASVAHKASQERKSTSRQGIDMSQEQADRALAYIKGALARGLSPYEISTLYEDEINLHRSTIYRWVEAGYGGLTNLELERKVGFKPRDKKPIHKSTSHSKKRAYERYCKLSEELKATRSELDCVIGRKSDKQVVLTFYNVPSHVQLTLLLEVHDCTQVKKNLKALRSVMPKEMYKKWTRVVLTDNGEEFCDEEGIGKLFGEDTSDGFLEVHLYYCDPRQSQQKGSCEKNHSEVRQILQKGMFCFDELTCADMSVIMSHVNSNPRASLGGKTPIQMLRFIYGEQAAEELLDAFNIQEISRDQLILKPEILDIERKRRGEDVLTRLK